MPPNPGDREALSTQKTLRLSPEDEKEAVRGERDAVPPQAEETVCAKAPRQREAWWDLGQATGQCGWGAVSRGEQTRSLRPRE